MDTATETIAALCAELTNYERDRPDRVRFSLDSMRTLLARPGAPALPTRLVQVGGSKGKGTTARYLAALAPGRTGVYQSPHAETVLERVLLDGRNVDLETLVAQLEPVLAFARERKLTVSFYEVMTAAALGCFEAHAVDFGVLEVGLGGRLDATTAVDVDASVLTTVELEHTELLGDTIAAIAGEKSHIVRPGKPAVVGVVDDALEVVTRRAADVGADLRVQGRDFDVEIRGDDGASLDLALRDVHGEAACRLHGAPRYEARALVLAWATHRVLDPSYSIPAELDRPHAPACFERVEPGFVLDGAHTPASIGLLVEELDRCHGDAPRAVLFATAVGKRWRESFERLLPGTDRFFVTSLDGTKSEEPAELVAWLRERGAEAEVVADEQSGVDALCGFDGIRVVTGSFYLAGAVRGMLRRA